MGRTRTREGGMWIRSHHVHAPGPFHLAAPAQDVRFRNKSPRGAWGPHLISATWCHLGGLPRAFQASVSSFVKRDCAWLLPPPMGFRRSRGLPHPFPCGPSTIKPETAFSCLECLFPSALSQGERSALGGSHLVRAGPPDTPSPLGYSITDSQETCILVTGSGDLGSIFRVHSAFHTCSMLTPPHPHARVPERARPCAM